MALNLVNWRRVLKWEGEKKGTKEGKVNQNEGEWKEKEERHVKKKQGRVEKGGKGKGERRRLIFDEKGQRGREKTGKGRERGREKGKVEEGTEGKLERG